MSQNAADALKEFDADGKAEDVQPASSYAPSIKIHDEDSTNVGQYVSGRLLRTREANNNGTLLMFVELRLEKTNARATVKKGKEYPTVEVKAGEIVSVYASSRLYRAAKQLTPGTRVFFQYDGQKKVETPKGKKLAHIWTVKSLPGNLTPEDVEYLKSRNNKAVSDAEASTAKVQTDAEAKAAMADLDD